MGEAVKEIDPDALKRVSFYIASLPKRPYLPSIKGDVTRGAAIYQGKCLPCHGEQAEGKRDIKTGALAVFEDWYLITQLRHFKHGRRGIHNQDLTGRTMAEAVKDMTDQEFRDVVAYIAASFGHTSPRD